jgi:hypothetical protein
VEVRAFEHDFPFEALPLLGWGLVPDVVNLDEVLVVLSRFLGFGAAVRRVPMGHPPVVADLTDERIGVQYVRYLMPGAIDETRMLRCLNRVAVEGPWPPEGLAPDAVRRSLIDALWDPARGLDGVVSTEGPTHIQHFACHATAEDPANFSLLVGSEVNPSYVALSNIRDGFIRRADDLRDEHAPVDVVRPLVVVNACGSATIHPDRRESFARWFIGNGHRGFVGTEIDVPDAVAAEFSRLLYRAFLVRGLPIAEALAEARVRLLTDRGSPLGLLYCYYGDPDLRVLPAAPR